MNRVIIGVLSAIVGGAALGLGGWSLAQSAENEVRIAVEEERSIGNARDHATIIKQLERQESQLDRILEKLHVRDPR